MNVLSAIPVIGDLVESLTKGIDEIFTSDEERGQIDIEKKKIELKKLVTELKAQHAQLQINLEQASHPSIFVAGARPAIIWIGALGLMYEAIIRPIASWIAFRVADLEALAKTQMFAKLKEPTIDALSAFYSLPSIDQELFLPIIFGVLGLGGMRTWEKLQGKARENMSAGSGEFKQMAETMMTRYKEEKKALEEAQTGNASIDQYKQASAKPGFMPHYPDLRGNH